MIFAFRFVLRLVLLAAALAITSPLQAAPLNIVAIGASNTTGFGVGEANAYPAVLQALLRKRGINANVTNAGVNGDVTAGMLSRLEFGRAQRHRHRHFAARRQRSALLRHQGGA